MTAEQLRRLLVAPEIVVVDLLGHALGALRHALLAEHPLLDDDLAAGLHGQRLWSVKGPMPSHRVS